MRLDFGNLFLQFVFLAIAFTESNPYLNAWQAQSRASVGQGEVDGFDYKNHTYGISFQYSSRYTLFRGQGAGVRARDFMPGPDRGEYLFAKLELPGRPSQFPVPYIASRPALYFGIHLGLDEETCQPMPSRFGVPPTDPSGNIVIDGVTFLWQEYILPHSPRSGPSLLAQRDYAAYSHGVCYEFHARFDDSSQGGSLSDWERVLSTVKFMLPDSSLQKTNPHRSPFTFPSEIARLQELADWQVTYPNFGTPLFGISSGFCGVEDLSSNNKIQLDYGDQESDDATANAHILKLEGDILRFLKKEGWTHPKANSGNGASELKDCYQHNRVVLTFSRGTSRCTMNSPCLWSDSITVTILSPAPRSE